MGARYSANVDEYQREYDISDLDDVLEEGSATAKEKDKKNKPLLLLTRKGK